MQPTSAVPTDARLAAIDVGSNSVRLVVAQAQGSSQYRILDEERENTRLAFELARTGRLSDEAMAATLAALAQFKRIAEGHGVEYLRAIATSAIRDAQNGPEFCRRVLDEIGLALDVIPSREEARLAFLSVARAFDVAGKDVAVADIGGGSTEIVIASNGLIDQVYATQLGAVRVAERCNLLGKSSRQQLTLAQRYVDKQLKRHARDLPLVPSLLYGTGGTFTAMANILSSRNGANDQSLRGYRVKRAEVHHLLVDLASLSLEARMEVPGLNVRRADIIVAGLLVIERIMRHLGVNAVQVHTKGVRDGMLLEMIQEGTDSPVTPEQRLAALEQFADRCGSDLVHARQVARIAARLFDQLVEPLGLDPKDRELLTSAALLANVGYLVNYDDHHKHSYQLILHSELPGFDPRQLHLVACIARYHRGANPKKKHAGFGELAGRDQQCVAQLASLLRLALGLDRTHQQQVENLRCSAMGDRVVIQVAAREDAETDIWAARRKVTLFEKTFGREVSIVASGDQQLLLESPITTPLPLEQESLP